ncbi:hypothetical protein [Aliterella atlantica]|uniref:Uncharacterized protein n=1 Tax=Aliterella atlantica CENA595 TaxID=1618023 RepID=A0A0D8ZPH2_9CYAN|nr:hypothetical protein [Aliterella atlantica]KJH70232.1 hypothetical protein UH38_18925 [Aliterella atlantica CENA595]
MRHFLLGTTFFTLLFTQSIASTGAQSIADISGEDVVATAGLGNNEAKIVTLTPRWWNCRQSPSPDKCTRENQGTIKTTYTVNCAAKSVHFSNEVGSGIHDVVPGEIANYNFHSIGIYDYACGTNYSEGWTTITIKKR